MTQLLPEYERIGTLADGCRAITAAAPDDVEMAIRRGYAPENVFFLPSADMVFTFLPPGCRPVASSLEQLRQIDRAAAQAGGGIISVGLRLIPPGYRSVAGIPAETLSEVARILPSLCAVTVRGSFLCGDLEGLHGKELGRFFRACYESAKRMTVTLPCAMPYLCVEGGLAALQHNRTAHPETLDEAVTAAQIVAAQNSTAFYARLMIK